MKKKINLLVASLSLFTLSALSGCNQINHEHTYSSSWSNDESGHRHSDTCNHNTKKDFSSHDYVNDMCTVCNYKVSSSHVHKYDDWKVDEEPTFQTIGKLARICTSCQNKEEFIIPVLNKNDYSYSKYKDGTCIKKEIDRYTYLKFGKTFIFEVESDYGDHSYGEWSVFKEPTIETIGKLVRYCTYCNNYEEYTLPILNNSNYSSEVIEKSTCINKGKIKYILKYNNQTFEFISEGAYAEHIFENGKCKVCGEKEGTKELQYTLSKDKTYYEVSGISDRSIEKIIIPNVYNNLPVKGIANYAFSAPHAGTTRDSNIISIKLPNTITRIGNQAFDGCIHLKEINIPESVTEIGSSAFSDCESLVSITIPGNVKSIGGRCFSDCINLNNINICDGVKTIEYSPFIGCNKLTSLFIPSSVSYLRETTQGCNNLSNLKIDSNNKTYYSENNCIINKNSNTLIAGCYNSIIPETVTTIGEGAFEGLNTLTSIIIPSSVKTIGAGAFVDCTNLQSIILPEGLKSIGNVAFCRCDSISSIFIPSTLTSLGEEPFCEMKNLIKLEVSKDNPIFYSNLNSIIEKESKKLVCGCTTTIIPNEVTKIGEGAFRGCYFSNINIPNNVIEIEDWAFTNCINLQEISIPSSVTKIGKYIFDQCFNLSSISLPDNLTEITDQMFMSCYNLTSITLPKNLIKISNSAFDQCELLEKITFNNNLEEIDDDAFSWNKNLKSIVLPNSLKTIGNSVFYGCQNLESVIFPTSITNLGNRTFDYANKVTIYYLGSYSEWIAKFNSKIELSKLSFYSEAKPNDNAYSYWHYQNGIATKW